MGIEAAITGFDFLVPFTVLINLPNFSTITFSLLLKQYLNLQYMISEGIKRGNVCKSYLRSCSPLTPLSEY